MRHKAILSRIHLEQSQDMISENNCIWTLSEGTDLSRLESRGFTDPFRYNPDELTRKAAQAIISRLTGWADMPEGSPERIIEKSFAEGKMLGVLICRNGFLAAFSGTVKGLDGQATASVDGFVPPIIDLTEHNGYFKKKEAVITQINKEIEILSSSTEFLELKSALASALTDRDSEIHKLQKLISLAKMQRDKIRTETSDSARLEELIRESQFQKAELKRCKDRWKTRINGLEMLLSDFEETICRLKARRATKSDELQKWIFENTIVHNADGEKASVWKVFSDLGLIPPGGTGDCAAPKLLNYAFTHGMEPLAMGEFWYGKSPDTAVRTHGHFYPSCTSKCGPLLGYMLKGLRLLSGPAMTTGHPLSKLYEDESIIVVEKPSGMPSVPGLDGRTSLQEILASCMTDQKGDSTETVHAVHRLDMDTSGIMIFAKTAAAAVNLQRQFEEHTVRKTYVAKISAVTDIRPAEKPEGTINLPLSPDYDERPRQKVDFIQGRPAHTEYRILHNDPDGTADIMLFPHTGRTHQLRVHCAHHLGLGRPIVGDLLYGGQTASDKGSRLCLHALNITFRHPATGEELTFTSDRLSY